MMEASRISETLVKFGQTARRYSAEDIHFRSQCSLFESVSEFIFYGLVCVLAERDIRAGAFLLQGKVAGTRTSLTSLDRFPFELFTRELCLNVIRPHVLGPQCL